MLAGDDVVLIAERGGRAVGYAFLHWHEGPDDTWPVADRWGEVVSLSVLPEDQIPPDTPDRPASHIHISGTYGSRTKNGEKTIELMPLETSWTR